MKTLVIEFPNTLRKSKNKPNDRFEKESMTKNTKE
jgi:hypothetical protein